MKVGANGAGRTENPFPLRGKVRMGVNGQSNRPYTSRPSPYPNSYSYMAKPTWTISAEENLRVTGPR